MATVFVGGSALLLAGAMAALAFGFANGEETLVWTALVASAGAAVFLVIAYVISIRQLRAGRSRAEAQAEAMPSTQESPVAEVATQSRSEPEAVTEREVPASGDQEVAPAPVAGGSPTTTKPSTAKKSSAPGTAAAAKPSSPSDGVVAVVAKKKFHRPECRYSKSQGAEEMTRAAARRRGFNPCGICKP